MKLTKLELEVILKSIKLKETLSECETIDTGYTNHKESKLMKSIIEKIEMELS